MQLILSKLEALMQAARHDYNVNPVVFVALMIAASPVFYYSIYRTVRALARQRGNEVMLWSAIFLAATAAPYLYVLLFGRNLPWWVYGILAVLIGQGVFSLVRKLRGAGTRRAGEVSPPRDKG